MIGALIGDIVGSRFEFNNIKTKNFTLINENSRPTDDSVMTIAVADWAMNAKDLKDPKEAASFLQKWGRKYPNAGYGGYFIHWLFDEDPKPYNSYGNGSAMRISSVGWLFNSEEEVKEAVTTITSVSHNHPEGIKGALVTALMVFKARHGASKEELKEFALSYYPEIANLDYDELVKNYKHEEEICQVTLPQAIYCFLISNDFEDCLRTTISIGGDCDTTSAISCAIAEAYYKDIDTSLYNKAIGKLSISMLKIVEQFQNIIKEQII